MLENDDSDIQAQLDLLARKYHAVLNEDIQTILGDMNDFAIEPAIDRAKILRNLAHRVSGSAYTYGYDGIGDALKVIEHYFEKYLDDPVWSNSHFVELIESLSNVAALSLNEKEFLSTSAGTGIQTLAKIYVVESDPEISQLLMSQMDGETYQISMLQSIDDLEKAYSKAIPNALIIDSDHYAKDFDRVKSLGIQFQVKVPIFMISKLPDFQSQLEAVRQGIVAFFDKPLDIVDLVDRLRDSFDDQPLPPYRVMLVDDDQLELSKRSMLLQKRGVETVATTDAEQVFSLLEDFLPELLIVDLHMPECFGHELTEVIRLQNRWLHIPVIYLSAENRWDKQFNSILSGGDQFISKKISDDNFLELILARVKRARNITELMSKDSLTGLFRHGEIKEQLHREFLYAKRQKTTIAVAMLDIDHFKRVNDTYGHPVGDKVIAALAQLLSLSLRTTDIIGRYGGEEFLVVMPNCDLKSAEAKITSILQEFKKIIFLSEEKSFFCSFSAGCVALENQSQPDILIEQADRALYKAKESGRSRVVGWKSNSDDDV